MRVSKYIVRAKDPILVETWVSTTDVPMENKRKTTYYNKGKTSSRGQVKAIMIYLSDNRREDKHTARQHARQTRPHVAPRSLLHHQYAAKLSLRLHLRSGEEHRLYSVRRQQTRRDDRAPHKAYNAQVSRAVRQWAP
jgi:hypothetical protein